MLLPSIASRLGGGDTTANTGASEPTNTQDPSDPSQYAGLSQVPELSDYAQDTTYQDRVDTTGSYIDPAVGTVAGQLDAIIAENSPLMQRARSYADVESQGKGLLSTSMAQRAGQSALYDAALPIAQQDASTYAQEGLASQAYEQGLGSLEKQQGIAIQQQSQAYEMEERLSTMASNWEKEVANASMSATTKLAMLDFMGSMTNQYMASMVAGMSSSQFNVDESQSVTNALNDMFDNMFSIADYSGWNFSPIG